MDSEYINSHLLKLAELFYGKNNNCFSKKKGDYYLFGSKSKNIKNKLTKEAAMFFIIGKY